MALPEEEGGAVQAPTMSTFWVTSLPLSASGLHLPGRSGVGRYRAHTTTVNADFIEMVFVSKMPGVLLLGIDT